MNNEITIKTELRPCVVGRNQKKALFHKWVEKSEIVAPSPMVGGHGGGTLKYTVGLVEYSDGSIEAILPHNIKFVDDLVNTYFKEVAISEVTE